MTIKIIKWHLSPDARKLGSLLIQYHKLLLPCDLVMYSKKNQEKIFIRMPEICLNGSQRIQFKYWIDQADSQNFQQEVLRMMHSDYGIDLAAAKEIYARYAEQRRATRKKINNEFTT